MIYLDLCVGHMCIAAIQESEQGPGHGGGSGSTQDSVDLSGWGGVWSSISTIRRQVSSW